jgi:hypothetical protein
MIIKSMARKETSFKSLIEYMHKEGDKKPRTIMRNLLSDDIEKIVKIFEENAKFLPKRKNGNYLYHEIITIPKSSNISEKKQEKILLDLSEKYLEKRASDLLSYGVIHHDTDNLHIHLLISANELYSDKRFRLTKKNFSDIQKEIEEYKIEKYPKLDSQKIYTQNKTETKTISQKEFEVIKRGGTSKKKEIIDIVKNIIERSQDLNEFNNSLEKIDFKVYVRGQNIGLEKISNQKRYRLKTLGINEEYLDKMAYFEKIKERSNFREKSVNKEVDKIVNMSKKDEVRIKSLVRGRITKGDFSKDKDLDFSR